MRVDGTPYPHRRRWRVRLVAGDGARRYRSFATRELAEKFIAIFRAEHARTENARTVDEAVDAYEKHLTGKGNKTVSTKETVRRLRRFFDVDTQLPLLTPAMCEALYAKLVATPGRNGKPLRPDSHRNMLLEARSFLRWCREKGWIAENPLEGVKGEGKRSKGKPQPRLDEARKWKAKALELAAREPGAVAALMTMMMGLRASEITKRVVRDLDDDGRVLWVEDAKTEAGNAPVEVPEELQPLLLALAKDRKPHELLFGRHWRDWPRENVQRICKLADVPEVTAHGMRGFASTLLMLSRRGSLDEAQRTLRHASASTTEQSYVDRAALERARRRASLEVLDGGKGKGPQEPERSPWGPDAGTWRIA